MSVPQSKAHKNIGPFHYNLKRFGVSKRIRLFEPSSRSSITSRILLISFRIVKNPMLKANQMRRINIDNIFFLVLCIFTLDVFGVECYEINARSP